MSLLQYQRTLLSGNYTGINQVLQRVNAAQSRILTKWSKERIQVTTSISRAKHLTLMNSNRLPRFLQDTIMSGGVSRNTRLQEGTYHVCQEVIHGLNGSHVTLNLYVRSEFDHTSNRKYRNGNTLVNETTYHYNIIYEWR